MDIPINSIFLFPNYKEEKCYKNSPDGENYFHLGSGKENFSLLRLNPYSRYLNMSDANSQVSAAI